MILNNIKYYWRRMFLGKINIYQLNDFDWYAGKSLEEVKKVYLADTGLEEDEALDDPRQLSEKELDTLTIADQDSPDEKISFREYLKILIAQGTKFPYFFASTEI